MAASNTSPSEIAAVGFSGQMHGAVLLDAAGEVLRPALIWCDQRTAEEASELTAQLGEDQIIAWTCNPALTNFTLTKLLWVRKHEPKLFERFRTLLLPKDYVRYRLTGEFGMDMSDASGTLLLDVANRRWSTDMARATGIDPNCLPPLFESPDVCASNLRIRRRSDRLAARALRSSLERAIRPQEQSVSASSVPAPCTPPSEPQAWSSPQPTARRSTPKGGCTLSATPFPHAGTSWA